MFERKMGAVAAAVAAAMIAGAAVAAPPTDSTMTVDANLVTACEVTATSAIHFGDVVALQSTGDVTANSGSTFKVACSHDAVPVIYSAT